MYHVRTQGVDERIINVHYYYYSYTLFGWCRTDCQGVSSSMRLVSHVTCQSPVHIVHGDARTTEKQSKTGNKNKKPTTYKTKHFFKVEREGERKKEVGGGGGESESSQKCPILEHYTVVQ